MSELKTFTTKIGSVEIEYRHTCEVELIAYRPPRKGELYLFDERMVRARVDCDHHSFIVREVKPWEPPRWVNSAKFKIVPVVKTTLD